RTSGPTTRHAQVPAQPRPRPHRRRAGGPGARALLRSRGPDAGRNWGPIIPAGSGSSRAWPGICKQHPCGLPRRRRGPDSTGCIMFSVLFEVHPKTEQWDSYLGYAKMLRPELEKVQGFVDNIRYRSLSREGWILSLSNWRDEKSLVRWRTQ